MSADTCYSERIGDDIQRHRAGAVNYPGDFRHIIGEIKGPTTYGVWLIATRASYTPMEDYTRVTFSYATEDDLAPYANPT